MIAEINMAMARELLPSRPRDGHKGTFGHLFVIAGSRGFTGAAKMTSEAAMRAGTGLVTCGIPVPLGDIVAASLLEVMTLMLPATNVETLSRGALAPALDFSAGKDAVVIGPGLSQHEETQHVILEFVRQCPLPVLIDADGLNAVSTNPDVLLAAVGPRVLTPHPGEMARLTGLRTTEIQADREATAFNVASKYGCVVVLKGQRTVVAGAKSDANDVQVFTNTTGNSGMASGGTGDVLSGVIGGLMAQGLCGLDAAVLGVFVHGLVGDMMARQRSERGLIARDLIDGLCQAWLKLETGDEQ